MFYRVVVMIRRNEPPITPELVAEHGLKPDEYERIVKLIGRVPSFTELGIFSAMCKSQGAWRAPAKLWTSGNCPVKGLFGPIRSP